MVIIISVSWSTNYIISVISGSYWLIGFPPHHESYLPACLYAWYFSLDARHCELLVYLWALFREKIKLLGNSLIFSKLPCIFIYFIFHWSLVELQCFVNYCCAAPWFSYTHIPTHIYSFSYFPFWFITWYWVQFPVLHSRTLVFIHICPLWCPF